MIKEIGEQFQSAGPCPKPGEENGQWNEEAFAKKMEAWGKCFGEKMKAWGEKKKGHGKKWGGCGGGPWGWGGPKHHWGPPKHCWGPHGGPHGHHGGPPHGGPPHGGPFGGGHKLNRCRLVKGPEGTLVGRPGETIFIQAEFRNNTYYPFKPGCQIVCLQTSQVIEDVKMPVEMIEGMTNFTLTIPVKIKDGAIPDETQERELFFGMLGPRGWSFGETLIVKLKVLQKIDEMEVFIRVKSLIDSNKEAKYSFEETLRAFKACGYDEAKTIEFISNKRKEDAMKFTN